MNEIRNPENILKEIPKDKLLEEVMHYKKLGCRLCQICAAYIDEKFELSYSFVDDDTNQMTNLRVVLDVDEEIPSITEIEPGAVFYENEMKELFGVKVRMISTDYHDKLYRIRAVHPLGPQTQVGSSDGVAPAKTPVEKSGAAKPVKEKEEKGAAE